MNSQSTTGVRAADVIRAGWRTALGLAVAAVLLAAPMQAEAQEASVSGEIPAEGGVALLISENATTAADLAVALDGLGCDAESIAITASGAFVVYVPGAPAFVNASFPADLDASQPFVTRCR